jgi:Ulp1 family protease
VEVTSDDLRRLQQEEFLNDTVIDLWLKKMSLGLVRSQGKALGARELRNTPRSASSRGSLGSA